ncbi:LuxR family transcriptional regulator, partial [Halomonas litopenaei]|nr:LuxR family transcriptional regulator [Halomonas litopenaei]
CLTTAECRVADLVLKGLSNTSIAEHLGVGPETVKSQFSSVLAKTNCRNRVAFIWRVFQILPPIK